MLIIPIYDMMLLPGVTFYFKSDVFQVLGCGEAKAGDDVLFLMKKSDKERSALTAEDFYPVGISARLEAADNDENIRVLTGNV